MTIIWCQKIHNEIIFSPFFEWISFFFLLYKYLLIIILFWTNVSKWVIFYSFSLFFKTKQNNPTSYIKLMTHICYGACNMLSLDLDSSCNVWKSFKMYFIKYSKAKQTGSWLKKITMFIRKTDKKFSYRLPSWQRSHATNLNILSCCVWTFIITHKIYFVYSTE